MLRLITTSTGLPLRDLTKWAEKLEASAPDAITKDSRVSGQTADASQDAGGVAPAPQRSKRPKRSLFPLIGLTPFLLIALFAATAFGLQTYQSYSYNTLLAQIHTHTPLYQHSREEVPADYDAYKADHNLPFDAPAFQTPGDYRDGMVEITAHMGSKEASAYRFDDGFALLLHVYGPGSGILCQSTPRLKPGACGRTPPQLGIPMPPCRFGFAV